MAKRKQTATHHSPSRKRVKGRSSSPPSPQEDREYKLRSILEENQYSYLIDWEDDEVTGEKFAPTWEPKRNANRRAIADWKKRKAANAKQGSRHGSRVVSPIQRGVTSSPPPSRVTATNIGQRKYRLRRVILSSPTDDSLERSNNPPHHQSDSAEASGGEIFESQPSASNPVAKSSPLLVPADYSSPVQPRRTPGLVYLPEPPSSFFAGNYEHPSGTSPTCSQSVASQQASESHSEAQGPSSTANTTSTEDPHDGSLNSVESPNRVVPDSQSLHTSSSYLPTTGDEVSDPQDPNQPPASLRPTSSQEQLTQSQSLSNGTSHTEREPTSAQAQFIDSQAEPTETPKGNSEEKSHVASADAVRNSQSAFKILRFTESTPRAGQELSKSPRPGSSRKSPARTKRDKSEDLEEGIVGQSQWFPSQQSPRSSSNRSSPRPAHTPRTAIDRNTPQAIDLTVSQYQGIASTAGVSVTPFSPYPAILNPIPAPDIDPLSSSQTSFPFATQLPPPSGSVVVVSPETHRNTRSADLETHQDNPRVGSYTLAPVSQIQPGHDSASIPSSSIPSVPLYSIDQHLIGESAPLRAAAQSLQSMSLPNEIPNMALSQLSPKHEQDSIGMSKPKEATPATGQHLSVASDTKPAAIGVGEPRTAVPSRLLSEEPSSVATSAPTLAPFLEHRARSPSAVPAEEPLPIITHDEMDSNDVVNSLAPQSRHEGARERSRNGSLTSATAPRQRSQHDGPETANVHTVPLILTGHQSDDYPLTVSHYGNLIERFMQSTSPDGKLLSEVQGFINVMRNIVLHLDLNNSETQTQYDVEPSEQANWDTNCSVKFRFLRDLLDQLRGRRFHIAIEVESNRVVTILETFMKGLGVPCSRGSGNREHSSDPAEMTLRATLLSPGDDVTGVDAVDLLVVLDGSVTYKNAHVRSLRYKCGKWVPFINLVVPRSVEHIDQSLSPTLSETARAKAIVRGIRDMKDEAGKRREGSWHPSHAAQAVAQYLIAADETAPWPIDELQPLEDLDSQTDSEADQPALVVSTVDVEQSSVVGEKRARESEDRVVDGSDPSKRPRMGSPQATAIEHQDQAEITHISDSVGIPSQRTAQDPSSSSSAMTDRYVAALAAAQAKVDEHVQIISELQYRFEDQRAQLLVVAQERDQAIETAQQAITRYSEQTNQLSTLRTAQSALKEQLAEANTKLQDHAVPERAEFETLRIALEAERAKTEKLTAKVAAANDRLDYIRGMYQSSSSSASTSAAQVAELEAELAIEKTRASGEQARARQFTLDAYTRNLQNDKRKLKSLLRDRESALRALQEEHVRLKEASRGRMGTRGTSVPRSPRVGSPMRGGPRSRQASPAAGELRGRAGGLLHPLRKA